LSFAIIARVTRSCMPDVLNQHSIRTARAKGAARTDRPVAARAARRLAAGRHRGQAADRPPARRRGGEGDGLSRPGGGRLAIQAISARNSPVAQAVMLAPSLLPGIAIALTVLACNLRGDDLRDALDPRMDLDGR
jgi:peptide/nickel transport system permease protein